MYSKGERLVIWLDSFLWLEYKHKKRILERVLPNLNGKEYSISALLGFCKDYLESQIEPSKVQALKNFATEEYLEHVLSGLERQGVTAVTNLSADYPKLLEQTDNPPLILYAKGNTKVLNDDCFSIVGSRRTLPISISTAKNYAKSLSDAGLTLVTGIAQGVDETVIKSVLETGGKVISVVAGGLDCIYPKTNEKLVDEIIEKGVVVSEHPLGVVSKPFMFPIRNRIIAGLSRGVLIVSAGKKSGALYTAQFAGEYGRDIFAVPYGIGVASGEGCNDLIKRGAMLTDTPTDVTEYYGLQLKQEKIELNADQKQIVDALRDGAKHIEQISNQINKNTSEIIPVLATLELLGVVVKCGNVYQLVKIFSED